MYCGRPRELTITETQSHPRGANAKGCGLGILTFATQLSVVPTHSCALAGSPNAHECDQRAAVSEYGGLFRAAEDTEGRDLSPAGLSSRLPQLS